MARAEATWPRVAQAAATGPCVAQAESTVLHMARSKAMGLHMVWKSSPRPGVAEKVVLDGIDVDERVEVRRWGGVSKGKSILIENNMSRDDVVVRRSRHQYPCDQRTTRVEGGQRVLRCGLSQPRPSLTASRHAMPRASRPPRKIEACCRSMPDATAPPDCEASGSAPIGR
jgi:hypothetical protein